jgi:hypothetical protein
MMSIAWYADRRRLWRIPNPAITIIPALACSGTLVRLIPLAAAKASNGLKTQQMHLRERPQGRSRRGKL